jgi:hypothetical protein
MIALPTGGPPYAIVPRLTVPNPGSSEPQFKPDLARFESSNQALIKAMLVTPLSDEQIRDTFDFQRRFYVVDCEFPTLRSNITQAHTSLRASVDEFSMPSKNDIDALNGKSGLSLPAILKLAYAFEAARRHANHAAIVFFGLQDRNPLNPGEPMVVPTLRTAEPAFLKAVRAAVGLSEKEILSQLTTKYRRPIRDDLLSAFLERPVTAGRQGAREGSYLLSEAFAKSIYDILATRKTNASFSPPRDFPTLNCLFEDDVPDMPGKGLYCQVLPLRYGHQLRPPTTVTVRTPA